MINNKPLWKICIGGIEATAWNNALKSPSGETVDRVAVTIDRRYKEKGGDWKSSSSLSLSDLMKAQVVIRHAIDCMVQDKRSEAA